MQVLFAGMFCESWAGGVQAPIGGKEPMGRPPLKPDDETGRVTITAPQAWLRRLDDWRRRQDDLPSVSEAIRRLVDLAMEVDRKGRRK